MNFGKSMSTVFRSRKLAWTVLGFILALIVIMLWLAPAEETLGTGIKAVYIHVALIWTGMTGLILAAVAGVIVAVTGHESLGDWVQTVGWIALTMYGLGLAMSVVSASVNWGAMFWQEPRTLSALQVLAAGLIVQIAHGWPISHRLGVILRVGLAAFMLWSTQSTRLVLHPDNAARSSPSFAIQATFVGLFALCSLLAAWLIIYWRREKLAGPVPDKRRADSGG